MRLCNKAEIFTSFHPNQGHGYLPKSPMCLWGAENSKCSSAQEIRSPGPPSSGGSSVPSSCHVWMALAVTDLHLPETLSGRGEGTDIYKTVKHAKSLPRDFLALSHLILKASMITPFIEEKNEAQRAQSWVPFSSLCPQTSPVPWSRGRLICR